MSEIVRDTVTTTHTHIKLIHVVFPESDEQLTFSTWPVHVFHSVKHQLYIDKQVLLDVMSQ